MPAMLKRQQFDDNESNETEPRDSKCQQLNVHNDKEEKSLDKFEDEGKGEDIKYIPLLFVVFPQKESNCLTNINKRTKSLNHLVYIPKIG